MPFFGSTITKRRLATGSYDSEGGWINGAATDTSISADVQGHAKEEDLVHLPEGTRLVDTKVLYVDADTLRTVDVSGASPVQADRVQIESHWYQVQHVRDHRNILLHQKCIVVRELEP